MPSFDRRYSTDDIEGAVRSQRSRSKEEVKNNAPDDWKSDERGRYYKTVTYGENKQYYHQAQVTYSVRAKEIGQTNEWIVETNYPLVKFNKFPTSMGGNSTSTRKEFDKVRDAFAEGSVFLIHKKRWEI